MTSPALLEINTPQQERLQALYHLAVELSALHDLKTVLNTALHHCLALTESQFGFIGLTTPRSETTMDVVAIQGFHPSPEFYRHNHLIPLRPNLFARAVLENRAVRSNDAMTDPQRIGQPRGHPPVGTFLGVPLRIQDEPIGMIGVANRPEPYETDHEQLLTTYAAQVAIVIRNAQLYEQLTATNEALERKVADRTRQLQAAKEALAHKAVQLQQLLTETVDVQERERQRIAQDMHDGTNQLLIGAMLELKSAQQRIVNGRLSQATNSIQTVQNILHRVEAEIKQIIYDLRPPTLDALGLVPALRRYAEQFESYTGLPCAVEVVGEPTRLSSNVEISLYRLTQEALQNVSAHAQAQKAWITVDFTPATCKLSIGDDGRGFELHAVQHSHRSNFGLRSMQERAESLGGRLSIHTRLKRGTRVEVIIPVEVPEGQVVDR